MEIVLQIIPVFSPSSLHVAVTNQSNWGTSFPYNNRGDGIDDNNSSAAQLLLSLGAGKDEFTGEQEMVPEPRLRAQRSSYYLSKWKWN